MFSLRTGLNLPMSKHLVNIILISLPIHHVFHFENVTRQQRNVSKAFMN